ncbi:MAG: Rieske (2Fe-2S) protein [Bacteroidota bacterium]|nr:Rieske (2Fe-2S) protein [Bacteroidota bacterium]
MIKISEMQTLQTIGGAIKKRYSKVNHGETIIIIRQSEDHFVAYAAQCTHQGTEVKLPKGGIIVCPNHGSRFNIRDGKVLDGEAYQPLHQIQTQYDKAHGLLKIG